MERRDFLMGSLVGVGVGVGAEELAKRAPTTEPVPPECPNCAPCPPAQETWTGDHVVVDPKGRTIDLGPLGPDGRRLSYAQQGEDLVLQTIFFEIGITKPSYLDIGAFHPSVSNNTYLSYLYGSRGVLVEPNPHMVGLLRDHRPGDTVLGVGVGIDETTEADYYLIRGAPQLNTFSKEQAELHAARSGPEIIERVVTIPLVDINALIKEHFDTAPDLLSIDAEGLDLAILRRLDLSAHRPVVICAETGKHGSTESISEIERLLGTQGYVVRGGTFHNTIFIAGERLAVRPSKAPADPAGDSVAP